MEPVNNSPDTASLVSLGQHLPDANAKVPIFKAATVQMLVSQPDAVIKNNEPQFGPVYELKDGKETESGPLWKLVKSMKISEVDYDKWPLQFSSEQMKAYFESGRTTVLNIAPDNPTDQQESSRPMPGLELLLPESDTRRSWLEYFYNHPGQMVEDGLAQAFGPEGARYLRDQLDQLSTGNEQAQQWQEICKLLSVRDASSLPYTSSRNSPDVGKGEHIILDMIFFQENIKAKLADKRSRGVNGIASDCRIKICDFLKNAGIDGDLAFFERPVKRTLRGGGNPMNQFVKGGSVQFFLTTTQTRQLFMSLRSFVTDQVSGSKE